MDLGHGLAGVGARGAKAEHPARHPRGSVEPEEARDGRPPRGGRRGGGAPLGGQERRSFPGWITAEALRAAYGAATLVAAPSLCCESFNLMNLEGMAMGKPVITSFFGGPSEVVSHAETGFHVNPMNECDLSEKIARILGDETLAMRMGAAGRERAETLFDIKNTGKRLISLYERLLEGKMNSR